MDLTVFADPLAPAQRKAWQEAQQIANLWSADARQWHGHPITMETGTWLGEDKAIIDIVLRYIFLSLDWPKVCDLPVFIFTIISKYSFFIIICSTAFTPDW